MTLVGVLFLALLLRTWGVTQASMTHYDEFYYAQSGLDVWIIACADTPPMPTNQALSGLHRMLPFHAPPLYPLLIGAVHWFVGGFWYPAGAVVSAVLGTGSVALMYAVAGRVTRSPAAGLMAAGLLALSDLHIAYSRMWLTDAAFGFFFLLAMYCVIRLFEGFRWRWALAAGLACGALWNVKYNGWMPPAIGAAAWVVVLLRGKIAAWRLTGFSARREPENTPALSTCQDVAPANLARQLAVLVLAGSLAVIAFVPWLMYVERHFPGGYRSVVGHHRSFSVAGHAWDRAPAAVSALAAACGAWFRTAGQLLEALPAFRHWGWCLVLAGGIHAAVARARTGKFAATTAHWGGTGLLVMAWVAVLALGTDGFLLLAGAFGAAVCLVRGRPADVLAAVWLGAFLLLVPAYHAYLRLLVPAVPAAIVAVLRGWTLIGTPGQTDAQHLMLGNLRVTALAVVALLALSIWAGRFDVDELRGVWSCWSSRRSYRAFTALVARRTPRDAWLLCRSQPTLWYALPREYKGREDEPLLDYVPPERPVYLALDFHVHMTPQALGSVRAASDRLEEIGREANDLTPPAMLNLISPRDFWRKMKVRGSGAKASSRDARLPRAPDDSEMDQIILYAVRPLQRDE